MDAEMLRSELDDLKLAATVILDDYVHDMINDYDKDAWRKGIPLKDRVDKMFNNYPELSVLASLLGRTKEFYAKE